LQAPGFDPKWKSINLAATVPPLARFPENVDAPLTRESREPAKLDQPRLVLIARQSTPAIIPWPELACWLNGC
jgi:hypothetical protein